ncbi:MAG: hypothetical protein K2M50_00730 [Treponemataceae bacterium]|nr:hypothetical protein [Treponemataceae bacterium]
MINWEDKTLGLSSNPDWLIEVVRGNAGRMLDKIIRRIIKMAMKEIESFNVAPSEEADTRKLWLSFGWELKSTQEVKTNDSQVFTGQDSDGTEHYRTTAGEHHIKLTFERDPERKNYNELKSLEEQYYAIKDPYYPEAPRFITLLWLILIGVGLVAYVIPGIILLIIHIIIHVKKSKTYKEDYAYYTEKMNEVLAQRKEILAKAQALV